MYNSRASSDPDDADLTMINPSMLFDQNDEQLRTFIPVVRRQQQLGHQSNQTSPEHNRSDYFRLENDRREMGTQIEDILNLYRRDLHQESLPHLECHRQFLTRLFDLIRPMYSSNRKKIDDLDDLFQQINKMNEKCHREQKQQNEQLHSELCHLKQVILTGSNDEHHLQRMNAMINYEQWMEINDEIDQLHQLVQTQRERIQQLIELLTEDDENPPERFPYSRPGASDPPRFTPTNGTKHHSTLVSVPIVNNRQPLTTSKYDSGANYSSIRTCPICQAIFNIVSMTEEQFFAHVNEHID